MSVYLKIYRSTGRKTRTGKWTPSVVRTWPKIVKNRQLLRAPSGGSRVKPWQPPPI